MFQGLEIHQTDNDEEVGENCDYSPVVIVKVPALWCYFLVLWLALVCFPLYSCDAGCIFSLSPMSCLCFPSTVTVGPAPFSFTWALLTCPFSCLKFCVSFTLCQLCRFLSETVPSISRVSRLFVSGLSFETLKLLFGFFFLFFSG